ncbi:hypothetical protein AKJ16_DCAP25505 [Drosera capensis]
MIMLYAYRDILGIGMKDATSEELCIDDPLTGACRWTGRPEGVHSTTRGVISQLIVRARRLRVLAGNDFSVSMTEFSNLSKRGK